MFFTIFPNKNNTITDVSIKGRSKKGSNSGASEICEIFSLSGSGKSRILMRFDISQFENLVSLGDAPSSSVEFKLFLKSSDHYETTPTSFDLEVIALSRSWDEGIGVSMYDEGRLDNGFSNWNSASSTTAWTTPGADIISSLSKSQHFDSGFEDLNIDISNIVYAWLTGGVTNNGVLIKFSSQIENSSQDYYIKKFYSKNSKVAERRPKINAFWTKVDQDDRENVKYGISASLYYYRQINGHFQDPASQLFVNILNSSSTVVQSLTASRESLGIWKVSNVQVQPTSSTEYFRDVWFSGANQYFTGSFRPTYESGSISVDNLDIDLHMPNLRPNYLTDQKVVLRLVAKEKDYKPAIRLTASVGNGEIFLSSSFFSIENAETNETIIPFSTGSNQYGRLSYDKDGNYFTIWTKSLAPENIYKVKFLVEYNGQKLIFDKNWKFKINE